MGQLPLLVVFVSIANLAVLGRGGGPSVAGVNVSLDRLPFAGDCSTADSRAMVVSPVASVVVLPILVLGVVPGGVVTGGGVALVIAGSGQFNPQRSSVALLAELADVPLPDVSAPVQAARANADKTKSDADPIRMIFPTTQFIHR